MASFKEIVPDMNRLHVHRAWRWMDLKGRWPDRPRHFTNGNPVSGDATAYRRKPICVKPNCRGALNAPVPREAELTGSGGLEDPRQRPTAATLDPGTPMTLPSLKARQKPPKRA